MWYILIQIIVYLWDLGIQYVPLLAYLSIFVIFVVD